MKSMVKEMKIKQYCEENVCIKVVDFELLDVSFYGCDACFEFEIRDQESNVLLDTDYETIENAFMGVDDSEDIYAFLEEKGIDFSEEYDDDFDKLPDELKKEFEEYELCLYDDLYHEYFFDGDNSTQEEITDRIMDQIHLDDSKLYVIRGEDAGWIQISSDYFGIYLCSNDIEIHKVYNVNMQEWIYEVEGIFFYIIKRDLMMRPDYHLILCKRDKTHPHVVTLDDLENDNYIGYNGKAGDVLYDYEEL